MVSNILPFHYFIYLETSNNKKSKVFFLWIFSGNVNASGFVSCWYPQIYKKSTLEKFHLLCEKVFCYKNISNYYCNGCDQNPPKYILGSSVLEMDF